LCRIQYFSYCKNLNKYIMMKKILTLAFAVGSITAAQAQQRVCGAADHLHHQLQQDAQMVQNRIQIEQHTEAFVNTGRNTRIAVTIPVVVHVLYNTATQNISDAQIQSQLTVLNADFRKLNSDAGLVPAAFSSLAADCEINFCLAQQTPAGLASTGIIRKSTTKTVFDANTDDAKSNTTGGDAAWDATKYLNLWVVPSIKAGTMTGILGYAQFPGGANATDGVVIGYQYFGTTGTAAAPFNKGRTGTHEVGHWLNLNHIWGDDGTACTGSDLVGDTPNQADENYGCPSFPQVSCSNGANGDMFMNYMDYTDDACMYMFTAGQKARMQALFAAGGARVGLLTSAGCTAPATTGCVAPTGLNTSGVAQASANLSWTAVAGATSYSISYGVVGGAVTNVTGVTATSYNLSALAANTAYTWSVRAICTGGPTASVSANFSTLAITNGNCANGSEPTNNSRTGTTTVLANGVAINSQIGSATDIDWYKFSNTTAAKNIKLELTALPADYDLKLFRGSTQVGISQLGGTSSELIKYNNGTVTTYYAQVFGYSGAMSTTSCYNLKMSLSATAWRTAGGDEVEVEQNINPEKITTAIDVSVYPNPTRGNFTVDVLNTEEASEAMLMLVDVTGKTLLSRSINLSTGMNTIDIETQAASGLYQLIVRTPNTISTKRVLVQQ
jgi:hypothetical protein